MKNLIYLLLAGTLFVACNQANESSTASDPKKKEANTAKETTPAAQDPQSPANPAEGNTQQPQQHATVPSAEPDMTAPPAAGSAQAEGPVITFEKLEHDFGVLTEKGANEYSFKFTNTGTEPLIISAASASCGCTVPDWPREPIAPGASADIPVEFTPKSNGMNSKQITVTANTNPPTTKLTIKADVQVEDFGK